MAEHVDLIREAARVMRVGRVGLRVPLLAGEPDFFAVDHDDEVAGIDVRRVIRAVLAAQDDRDLHRQPADDLVGGVDQVPLLRDFALLGQGRGHGSISSGELEFSRKRLM